jgi:hypothetical protein
MNVFPQMISKCNLHCLVSIPACVLLLLSPKSTVQIVMQIVCFAEMQQIFHIIGAKNKTE